MLPQPPSCDGCALSGVSEGYMTPTLAGDDRYHVTLIGEALGAEEAKLGQPFVGPAGFKLTRLIEWAGFDRSKFDIWNVAWCRPPHNLMEGTVYEASAIAHCRDAHWVDLLSRSTVVVSMGNVALCGLVGKKGILKQRGYVRPLTSHPSGFIYPFRGGSGVHLLPTVHPSFIQRGQSKWSAPFIYDLQKAVELAAHGLPVEVTDYTLDPTPGDALRWVDAYLLHLARSPHTYLAFDIETPGKGDDEGDLDLDDPTYFIHRIGFSYRGLHALTVPWTPPYIAAIKRALGSGGPKVVWNAAFDVPRVRANGVSIHGVIHDGMVAWHILQSDLPKGLGFVATFTCPWQREWKTSLPGVNPALYNAIDADVELRSMIAIEQSLRESGLWGVYEKDVVQLEPILVHMSEKGMPIDHEVRYDRARKLQDRQRSVQGEMEDAVPIEARRWQPKDGFVRPPANTDGLITIRIEGPVSRCSACGLVNPTKPHFKAYKRPTAKRPQNPCSGSTVVITTEPISRFARLESFKPSREQLMRYQGHMNRTVPTTWDKKTRTRRPSMNEKAIEGLMRRFGDDPLYPRVLEYRELDKIAGTYIGRPDADS